jgi:superfamily II DNA/RNA helicase
LFGFCLLTLRPTLNIFKLTLNFVVSGINGVNWVVNFDYPHGPNSSEIYENRTSNLHGTGYAITLLTPSDVVHLDEFLQVLNQMNQVNLFFFDFPHFP